MCVKSSFISYKDITKKKSLLARFQCHIDKLNLIIIFQQSFYHIFTDSSHDSFSLSLLFANLLLYLFQFILLCVYEATIVQEKKVCNDMIYCTFFVGPIKLTLAKKKSYLPKLSYKWCRKRYNFELTFSSFESYLIIIFRLSKNNKSNVIYYSLIS